MNACGQRRDCRKIAQTVSQQDGQRVARPIRHRKVRLCVVVNISSNNMVRAIESADRARLEIDLALRALCQHAHTKKHENCNFPEHEISQHSGHTNLL
jgi:hypothetical protein